MGRRREVRKTTGNGAEDSKLKNVLGCSSATSNAISSAELEECTGMKRIERREKVEMAILRKEYARK